mmetsp:Transcript_38841/g.99698  ORF Transcript_38841/g.99698 Transcript_38841/m.99698 type:complete len:589 (-) Transcript_38841:645-2411(-)
MLAHYLATFVIVLLYSAKCSEVVTDKRAPAGVFKWAEEEGGHFAPLEVEGSGSNRKVLSVHGIEKGSAFAEVPAGLALSSNMRGSLFNSAGRKAMKKVIEAKMERQHVMEEVVLASFLLLEVAEGDNSAWQAFLADLPSPTSMHSHPLLWNEAEKKLLAGTDAARMIDWLSSPIAVLRELMEEAVTYTPLIDALTQVDEVAHTQTGRGLLLLVSQSWQRWAIAIVFSRAFRFHSDLYLVPAMDMYNHKKGGAKLDVDEKDGRTFFVLRTATDVNAGEELYAEYFSTEDSERAFVSYGFFTEPMFISVRELPAQPRFPGLDKRGQEDVGTAVESFRKNWAADDCAGEFLFSVQGEGTLVVLNRALSCAGHALALDSVMTDTKSAATEVMCNAWSRVEAAARLMIYWLDSSDAADMIGDSTSEKLGRLLATSRSDLPSFSVDALEKAEKAMMIREGRASVGQRLINMVKANDTSCSNHGDTAAYILRPAAFSSFSSSLSHGEGVEVVIESRQEKLDDSEEYQLCIRLDMRWSCFDDPHQYLRLRVRELDRGVHTLMGALKKRKKPTEKDPGRVGRWSFAGRRDAISFYVE